jgi:hypothetical protein
MLKCLPFKSIVPVAIAVTGFVAVACIVLYNFLKADSISDAVRHETSLADTVVKSTQHAMLSNDPETIRQIITDIGSQPGIVHVRIFNKQGKISYSSDRSEVNRIVDKQEAGCIGCHRGVTPITELGRMDQARQFTNHDGVPVIAITAPIYNEAACATALCHVHAAGQKVLGTLDIGLSALPLRDSLTVMRWRMTVFSIMVLFLTVGGVAAMLRRSLFLPLKNLLECARQQSEAVSGSSFDGGNELDQLLDHLRQQEQRLRSAETELAQCKEHQPHNL